MIFSRYNFIIRLTIVIFAIVVSILFYWQLQFQYYAEINLVRERVQEAAIQVDESIKTTADYVEQMQVRANSFYEIGQIGIAESLLFDNLKETEEKGQISYNLNRIPPPYTDRLIGNLTGLGTLRDRDYNFYREIGMAFALNPLFQTALKVIPNDIRAYYLSQEKFINRFPWVNSQDFQFHTDLLASEMYERSLPKNNPDREQFWTTAYLDPENNNISVTCAAPVYEENEFRGTIALDVTLDELSKILEKSKFSQGRLFLINNGGQVLASPENLNNPTLEIQSLWNLISVNLREKVYQFLQGENLDSQEFGQYLFLHSNLHQAPWSLVFFAQKVDILMPILTQLGLGWGLLLIGLTLMLAIANQIIAGEFIIPANQLIRYIEQSSQNKNPEIPENITRDWLLWFETISHIFQENQQMTAELVQQEKMSSLGQLVAGIAHEINNPVNFIYGNLAYVRNYAEDLLKCIDLYQQEYPNPTSKIKEQQYEIDLEFLEADLPKLIDSMEVGADRIREIVVSLRNFSRLDESDKKRVNIHQGIESTLTILENRLYLPATQETIEVRRNYGELPLVECYAGQLNQAFLNIISNAIDTLQESEKELKYIKIETSVKNSTYIYIKIADNGMGINEETQHRIFEPFFTTKPVGQGTGLGLSVSYKIIVERHQGKLKCHSTLGEGTEFIIEIPVDN
ncbi:MULTISPECIES: ATP-binding protein [Spirulina sp. CCY15215]|uniref:ATP-binding protein n=1 Tax=Spirulina sp. CCY15215 TaxID=2767591 RepID=UPI00194E62BD|nr:ATP-binding protein [Spirulina major]